MVYATGGFPPWTARAFVPIFGEEPMNSKQLTSAAPLDAGGALQVLTSGPEELMEVLKAADSLRRANKGDEVNLCSIVNARSGACAEDCAFCAQSARYRTPVETYPLVSTEEALGRAREAVGFQAREFSIVTSGYTEKKEKDFGSLSTTVAAVASETPLSVCASLGVLSEAQLAVLKESGLSRYHHNLETAASYFPKVCTTHSYEDDLEMVRRAKRAGFYVCSGGIFGLGESAEQRVELAMSLRELDVDSVPINFLNPIPGTPLAGQKDLTPVDCLKIIAMLRLMLPEKDLVVCGGREINLRDLQSMIFLAGANGMMVGGYLTTSGRDHKDDLKMIEDLGLKVRGYE
jgi:biotin synthase